MESYREKLKNTNSPREKQILSSGIIKLEHVIEKKTQMKKRFLDHLRKLQFDALAAEQMFLSDDFLGTAFEGEEKAASASGDDDGSIDDMEETEGRENP